MATAASIGVCESSRQNQNSRVLPTYAGGNAISGPYPIAMFCQSYIEALLADEELADQVQEAYESGAISERCAYHAWCLIAFATHLGVTVSLDIRPVRRAY